MVADLSYQLEHMKKDFDTFKVHHDLDRLFGLGIDIPTC
jgi:hypothetical protein